MTNEIWTDTEVIGAIRLAMEASTDSDSRIRLVDALLQDAEPTDPSDTRSTKLLIETIREIGGEVTVPA